MPNILLLHNHGEYEDFAIEKVLILPEGKDVKWYNELIIQYHIKRGAYLFKMTHTRKWDTYIHYSYHFLNEEEIKLNKHLFNGSEEIKEISYSAGDFPDACVSTSSIYNGDGFLKFLSDNFIQVLDPVYSK